MALLKILTGEQSGRSVELRENAVVVGRHPGCDIRVPDETVSRRHARIIAGHDGYLIEDLGSRNGTFLNGHKVTSPERLNHLDTFSIFNTVVEFRDELAGESAESTGLQTVALNGRPKTLLKQRAGKPAGLFETIAEIALTVPGVPAAHRDTDVKLRAVLEITQYLRSTLEPDEV